MNIQPCFPKQPEFFVTLLPTMIFIAVTNDLMIEGVTLIKYHLSPPPISSLNSVKEDVKLVEVLELQD